ncbi:MAG: arsenate reductase, partial [Planctomycetota bacterium]
PAAATCPTLPGASVLRWPFPDPDAATGTEEEIMDVFRASRDAIRARIESWLVEQGYSERRSLGPSSGSSAAE